MSSDGTNTGVPGKDAAAVESWIVAWIAKELRVDAARIDAREPLVNLGMGSRQAILLTGDLEEWLNVRLDPTLAWDHPTIEKLSAFVAGRAAQGSGDGSRG